jgi:hypothetical protein
VVQKTEPFLFSFISSCAGVANPVEVVDNRLSSEQKNNCIVYCETSVASKSIKADFHWDTVCKNMGCYSHQSMV